jgi:hypothetical protein
MYRPERPCVARNIIRVQFSNNNRPLLLFSSGSVAGALQVNISHSCSETATVVITSQSGKAMLRTRVQVQEGTEGFNLPVSSLPAGLYYITVDAPGLHLQDRFIKQ